MQYVALATDYDGTLAENGRVSSQAIGALSKLKETGRRLLLVTGRVLPELESLFPRLDLFDRIVAENGALLYDPKSHRERLLADPAPDIFIRALEDKKVHPFSTGRVIVASREPNQHVILETIRTLGLELQIIFNKGAVMVLPPGINKASGLLAALDELDISRHNLVGIGDAENDHAFLQVCGCSVAVSNALEMLKGAADFTTAAARGEGVIELIDMICADDGRLVRKRTGLELSMDGHGARIPPHGGNLLIAGHSGIGKSTLAMAAAEQMRHEELQFCIVDPEGDFTELDGAFGLGDANHVPSPPEVIDILRKPGNSVVVNLLGIHLEDRPVFFTDLLSELLRLRSDTGHPHWIIVDEAHHMLPAQRADIAERLPGNLRGTIFIAVDPSSIATATLGTVKWIAAVGMHGSDVISAFCKATATPPPQHGKICEAEQVLFWEVSSDKNPVCISPIRPTQEHLRHTRKYAEGELGSDRSFYFRGPQNKLNLRVHNLTMFLQVAAGVDDETWDHHLRAHDYSKWFRTMIKDNDLADAAAAIEGDAALDAATSRAKIASEIERRYTAPASQSA